MLRRLGPRRDGGAGLAEYAGLIVLAALILGALVAIGIPAKVGTATGSAICRIFQEEDCGKPRAAGKDPGGQKPGDQPTNGVQSPGGQNPNGDEPSLADLQKNADDAQKAANDTNGKYGNIKQEIIDLLKDFIGITDVEDCISKGSISACLWAAFDVASWIFAALKIAKFAKAVKDAVKLYKEFNKGRKIIADAEKAAKREKELLEERRIACGIPAAYGYPNAPPTRVVRASYTVVPAAAPDPNKCYIPAPKDLDPKKFPGAKPVKAKTPVKGGGGLRKRWKDGKGNIYEWDSQHGTVEKYNKRGKHLGEYDANTGEQTKPADPGRSVEP